MYDYRLKFWEAGSPVLGTVVFPDTIKHYEGRFTLKSSKEIKSGEMITGDFSFTNFFCAEESPDWINSCNKWIVIEIEHIDLGRRKIEETILHLAPAPKHKIKRS